MSGLGGLLPLSLTGWPRRSGDVTPLDDMRARREARTRWMRTPGEIADAANASTDPIPAPTLIRRTDEDIARMTALMERFALIGRLPDPETLTAQAVAGRGENEPVPHHTPEPDPFSEGALAMLRYLRGELDETSLLVNWASENGATP